MKADPFHWEQLPIYLQEALRGTQQAGYLLYFYPTEHLDNAQAVDRFASMIRDVEKRYPNLVSGSDALIFSDILGLILRDGVVLFILIIVFVGVFIGILLRNMKQALLCYVPFLISLPLTVGLMAVLHVRFNIFNVALLPALVAVGIEIPIQLMQRSREIGSGFKGVRDIAVSLHLALITTLIGFGVLVFTRAGVLKSMGWISIIGIFSIWIVGLFLHPAILERYFKKEERTIQSVPSAVAKFSD